MRSIFNVRVRSVLKACLLVCSVLFLAGCAEEAEPVSEPTVEEGQQLSFEVNLKQDWNALNAVTRSSEQLAAEFYSVPTNQKIDGKAVFLKATTLNGMLVPDHRKHRVAEFATRGTQIEDVDHFHNSMGILAYPLTGGEVTTPDFLYDYRLNRGDDNLWTSQGTVRWPKGTVRFFAYAPYHGQGITLSPRTQSGTPTLSYVTPSSVASQQDVVMNAAAVDVAKATADPIDMEFRHLLAAVRFKLGSPIQAGTIKKITIDGVKYKGTYDWATNQWTLDDETTSFTFTANQPTTDGNNQPLVDQLVGTDNDVFLVPPQALGEDTKAVITLQFDNNGTPTEVDLTANLYTQGLVRQWEQSHTTTYTITTGDLSFDYVFEVVEDELDYDLDGDNNGDEENLPYNTQSYKLYASGAKKPLEWNVTGYSYDGGTTWTTTRPSWLTLPDGYSGGEQIVEQHPADMEERALETEFSKRPPVEDFDLSTHDFKLQPQKRNTANCYIVNRPGSYKLPLVYGNAIKNGETNEVAYNPGSDPRFPTLYSDRIVYPVFLNHLDNPIVDPWIKNNSGCSPSGGEVVWQDVNNLVTNVRVEGDYLCFDIPAASIKGGNSIIAVTDASGTILWSWHIWVTDQCAYLTWPSRYKSTYYSWSTYWEPNDNITQVNDFDKEQLLLGLLGQAATQIEQRQVLVRFEQEESGNTDELLFRQQGWHEQVPTYEGKPLYYQWGRKDPMLRLNDEGTGNATMYNASKAWRVEQVGTAASDPRISIGTSIQNPNVMYVAKSTNMAWRNVFYENNRMCNLWNSINRKFITSKRGENGSEGVGWAGNSEFEKSIYDPCPVGYHVADPTFFFYQGQYTNQAAGRGLLYKILVDGQFSGTIYTASGWRSYSTGNVTGTASFVTWTSVISHEDISLALGIEYAVPFIWNSSDYAKWGGFVSYSSDFGTSFGCPIIPIKDKDWPEGWPFQP